MVLLGYHGSVLLLEFGHLVRDSCWSYGRLLLHRLVPSEGAVLASRQGHRSHQLLSCSLGRLLIAQVIGCYVVAGLDFLALELRIASARAATLRLL